MRKITSPSRFTLLALTLACAALCAASCTEDGGGPDYQPIDRQTATSQANLYLSTHARGVATSAAFIDASSLAHQGSDHLSALSTSSAGGGACVIDDQGVSLCDTEPSVDTTASLDMTGSADSLVTWFAEHVFTDARVTSAEATRVTYTLAADLFCTSDLSDELFGAPTTDTAATDCLTAYDSHPAQVELRALPDDTLQATLVVASARPLTLTLSPTYIGAEVDLAAVRAAALTLGLAAADDLGGLTLQGRVKAELHRLGERHYKGSLKVTQAVRVSGQAPSGDLSFTLQPSTISVEANGDARAVTLTAQMGALDLDMPFASDDPSTDPTAPTAPTAGTLSVHLDGASASATFSGDQDALTLQDVSLGQSTSTVKLNGQPILSIDLNPTMGRAFDLALRSVSDGAASMIEATVTPGFDLKLLLALQNAANVFGGDLPAWGRNEVLEVLFDGAPSPTLRMREGDADTLEVVSGRLTFSASSLSAPVVIEAGQCLAGLDAGQTTSPTVPFDPSDPNPPVTEPAAPSDTHPFSALSPTACQ